ncbi:hypothetical protein [Nigerium sp.]|uniref:hypothetical protein n=1 Tax=Nigerium sp. TaxID=2042655 RepID=UPI0032215DB9
MNVNRGFRFGIDGNDNQQDAVAWAQGNVDEMLAWREKLPSWEQLAQPGSQLEMLLEELPSFPPVDLRLTLDHALETAFVFLDEIGRITRQQQPSSPPVVLSDFRGALLASARVHYALLPDVHGPSRQERALKVMRQEANSLAQLYEQAASLREAGFCNLPPEPDVQASLRAIRRLRANGNPPPRDANMLREVAAMMDQIPIQQGGFPGIKHELVATFNVSSGIVHGYGWPGLLWQIGDLPIDAPQNFLLGSILAHNAHRLVLETAGLDAS